MLSNFKWYFYLRFCLLVNFIGVSLVKNLGDCKFSMGMYGGFVEFLIKIKLDKFLMVEIVIRFIVLSF